MLPYFQMDNLSDSITVGYAKRFIGESEHLILDL